MEFKKYIHIERLGTAEVENIEFGNCYVFPKIDGTNASVWINDGVINAGSRTRHLSLESDNAGFLAWAINQKNILEYLTENPTHRLFGEWLVPHSLKTYKQQAWRNFYVFDVAIDTEYGMEFMSYEIYKPILEKFNIEYIPPICTILNSNHEQLHNQLQKNVYLIEDGMGCGEGVVIKRYDFKNRFGRTCWAKIVTSEFKEKHVKIMGAPQMKGEKAIEQDIAIEFVTLALIEKEYSKIANECNGWSSKLIPRLLNTIYYSIVKEDCWEFVKKYKNPIIDFKRLNQFVIIETKTKKPELF